MGVMTELLPTMSTPVDVVVMNAGLHPIDHMTQNTREVMELAVKNIPMVIWAETTPGKDQFNSTAVNLSPIPKNRHGILWEYKRATDVLVQNLCAYSYSSQPKGKQKNPNPPKDGKGLVDCFYVPFPIERINRHHVHMGSNSFWDGVHFSDVSLYDTRNVEILELIEEQFSRNIHR